MGIIVTEQMIDSKKFSSELYTFKRGRQERGR